MPQLGHPAARHPARTRGSALPGPRRTPSQPRAWSSATYADRRGAALPLADEYEPLARLLELIAARVGPQNFPAERSYDDASWVGYRLAELLPLPLSIKQSMLEINDAGVRLQVLQKFLRSRACSRPRNGATVRPARAYNFASHALGTEHHGRPQQVGEHQAQEGRDRRQARQDLHAPDQGNHGGRAAGRRRPVDESAAAPRGRQGDGPEHAEGHDRARDQARRGRPRRRELRGDPLRRLRHQRRGGDRRLHDRQPRRAPSPTSATRSPSTAATSAPTARSPSCSSTAARSCSRPAPTRTS